MERNTKNTKIDFRFIKDFLRKVPIYLYTKDLEQRFVYVNHRLSQACGVEKKEIIGKNIVEIADLPKNSYLKKSDCYDKKVLKYGEPLLGILESHTFRDGGFHIRSWKFPIINNDQVVGVFNVSIDVTGEIANEERMEDQQIFLQMIIDAVHHPIFIKDTNGKYLYHNKAFEKYINHSDIIGKSLFDFFPEPLARHHHEQDKRVIKKLASVIYRGPAYPLNPERIVLNKKVPFLRANGKLAGLLGIIIDVTNDIQTVQASGRTEAITNALMAHAPNGVLILDGYRIVDCNDMAAKIFSMAKEDLLSSEIIDLVPNFQPDGSVSQDKLLHLVNGVSNESTRKGEIVFQGNGLSSFYARVYSFSYENDGLTYILVEDITEQKNIESSLKEAREFTDSLISSLNDGVGVIGKDDTFLMVNDKLSAMLGLSPGAEPNSVMFLLPDGGFVTDVVALINSFGSSINKVKVSGICKTGKRVFLEITTKNTSYLGNEAMLLVCRDISEEKPSDAQSDHLPYEHLYKAIFENPGVALAILERDLSITNTNSSFERLAGHTNDKLSRKMKIDEILDQGNVNIISRFIDEPPGPVGTPLSFEATFRRRDGDKIKVLIGINVIPGTQQFIISVIESIIQYPLPFSREVESMGQPGDIFN